ncbi:tetratricopeptide (TPR) repeat protein [Luteibacter sp. 621]|uniref:tetratricopeptide repeat protein n=1 Tax=Luteibacter sp. 621 TaxID=3373916 RepID=UPI003D1EFD08
MSQQLPNEIYEAVTSLCKTADELMAQGTIDLAREKYKEALRLLPADHRQWEASTWIYVALGDLNFRTDSFERAFKAYSNAVQCANGLGNPYIHLRRGQSSFELGDMDRAADELARAYMGAGLDIFMEDDPKYLEFLETKIEI